MNEKPSRRQHDLRLGAWKERERIIALLKNSYHRRLCLDPDDVSTDGVRDCAIHWEGYECGCDELLALIKGDNK
jgi:hypothetical protein